MRPEQITSSQRNQRQKVQKEDPLSALHVSASLLLVICSDACHQGSWEETANEAESGWRITDYPLFVRVQNKLQVTMKQTKREKNRKRRPLSALHISARLVAYDLLGRRGTGDRGDEQQANECSESILVWRRRSAEQILSLPNRYNDDSCFSRIGIFALGNVAVMVPQVLGLPFPSQSRCCLFLTAHRFVTCCRLWL